MFNDRESLGSLHGATQRHRQVGVQTPLGEDAVLLRGLSGTERLGGLFEYELDLVSEDIAIDGGPLLGEAASVWLELESRERRYFHGIVRRFALESVDDGLARYTLTLVPEVWRLSQHSDCRIFQNLSAPDIVKEVLRDHAISGIDDRLYEDYEVREYCVQYRETDLDFISRLMEQEGIYYWFEHREDGHRIVLADSASSHEVVPGYETVRYCPPGDRIANDRPNVRSWSIEQNVRPARVVLDDFNPLLPRTSMAARRDVWEEESGVEGELFDYPGEYANTELGERRARVRLEERRGDAELVWAASGARGLACGCQFELQEHPNGPQNRDYVIAAIQYQIVSNTFRSGAADESDLFRCELQARAASRTFRPPMRTPKPVVHGPQTAFVCGPADREIWTDEHGRVKVQFHWDRQGQTDQHSSCWLRVAQAWAGRRWGAQFLPRVGNEVIVEFLDGDPDRPIVTGSVYNAVNRPVYELPANATVSGIKTRSSPGGEGYNELRFEDKAGEEEIFVHAQRDLQVEIENDEIRAAGNDRSNAVGNDDRLHVRNNRHVKVDADCFEEVGADRHLKVKGKTAIAIDGSRSLTVDGNVIERFKADHIEQTTGQHHVKAAEIVLEATDGITLKVGGSSVVVDSMGVTVTGAPAVHVVGSPAINLNSGSGSSPLSGLSLTPVEPVAPMEVEVEGEAHQPDPEETSWIEIELIDDDDNPVPGELYEIRTPAGTVATGVTDENGFARVAGFEPGECEICFPNLDEESWEPVA